MANGSLLSLQTQIFSQLRFLLFVKEIIARHRQIRIDGARLGRMVIVRIFFFIMDSYNGSARVPEIFQMSEITWYRMRHPQSRSAFKYHSDRLLPKDP
jgi:hypothetical protein